MLIYFQKVKTQAFAFQTIMLSAHYFRRSKNKQISLSNFKEKTD